MKIEKDYPTPKLQPGGVIVKNQYSGINFIDTYHRSGLYKRELPFIGGQEGGGFIAAASKGATACRTRACSKRTRNTLRFRRVR